MKVYFQDSSKYAGILVLPVLCRLQEECTIEYTANMVALGSRKDEKPVKRKATATIAAHDCSIRIAVYGLKSQQSHVSQLLSDADLCLQHSSAGELYRQVDYWNPHYLLRPGSQMPKLELLSISLDGNSQTTGSLDETDKSRFMQIFNSATGPSSPLKPMLNPPLKSTLKE